MWEVRRYTQSRVLAAETSYSAWVSARVMFVLEVGGWDTVEGGEDLVVDLDCAVVVKL